MTKTFNIIIAGGREFNDYELLTQKMNKLIANIKSEVVIISGTAKGADKLGERYAREHGLKIISCPANWNLHGKSAGYKRNQYMSTLAHAVVCCWDGKSRGTKHMIDISKESKLPLRIIKY